MILHTYGAPANKMIERKQFDLTLKVLEHVATYESSLKAECVQDGSHTERLIAEYYILRTCLVSHGRTAVYNPYLF